jgi:hypothetical protein
MKTTNKNFSGMVRIAVISFGVFALAMSCENIGDKSSGNQDSIDSAKSVVIKTVDTTAVKDTAKMENVNTVKP